MTGRERERERENIRTLEKVYEQKERKSTIKKRIFFFFSQTFFPVRVKILYFRKNNEH